ELVPLVDAHQGAIYQMGQGEETTPTLRRLAGYANVQEQPEVIPLGEGLVGQCAQENERILLLEVPENYTPIRSSLGEAKPINVVVMPVLFETQTKAVIELASLHAFTAAHLNFLEQLTESIGVVLNTIEATMRTENLLQQSQQLTAELQSGQKELQQTNEELEQKARELVEQNAEVERKNMEIDQARRAVEEKAAELALTSKYKSEFLANMSHELRTPLNSILILGQQLGENPGGNLTDRQVEFARSIHSAGSDLLNLINDILDLSKIESGTVTVDAEEIPFSALRESVERNFRHIAENKSLPFNVEFDPHLPPVFTTDSKRLQQIIKNLLSNAFKFTTRGFVSMQVKLVPSGWTTEHPVLGRAGSVMAIEISDSGIGIAPEKQKLIFEAFQQADAGTSRKYGGTGLGLAISRELATLLGGEIKLNSVPGEGSRFTLYLPLHYSGPAATERVSLEAPPPLKGTVPVPLPQLPPAREERVPDDREGITEEDPVLLIVDDDPHYARVLLGLARDVGFKGIVAQRGQQALLLARQYQPTAITLDVFLPDMLGWTVLNNLKLDPNTRHIPVQMISVEEERQHGLSHGAFSYLVKPATTDDLALALDRIKTFAAPRTRRLLVVEDNEIERQSIVALLGEEDLDITTVATGAEAWHLMLDRNFDCCVLDLRLPDMSGFDLLDKVHEEPSLRHLPIVVFTGKDLSQEEEKRLKAAAKSIVLKDVQSPERLLDETSLFLHRVVTNLPESKQKMLQTLHNSNAALRGRKVLVVDDDARNIFALSIVLENQEMEIMSATNGRQAIDIIENTPDLAVVLMD
ncbi:MAG TPA: response regulator, partial [Prosthecobacter sp.]|nr:response regulator [Prosthecobacter sp.]